jgi:hypothetical protein
LSKLQSIETKLKEINQVDFQELCDMFLSINHRGFRAFSRTGSQSGKQKTTKGTPDSFILLENGNFIYCEATTNSTYENKLENDIKSCFDTKKTNISIDKIEEIILCFNFKIDSAKINHLNTVAKSYKSDIKVTYWSLDAFASELSINHRDLVHQYLHLPVDTGQIVSIEIFLKEYERAGGGISTPLDNEFLHRKEEKTKLKGMLENTDIVILTGIPGVGKTKLALEVMSDFVLDNNSYIPYCISYKHFQLLEDLYQNLRKEDDFILLIDDANRIDTFNQIMGFYNSTRQGKLKLIITVRDYAYEQVARLCQQYNPERFDIGKLTDDEITVIIKSNPFNILNHRFQREILRIADGNPRLAIMAAQLAKEKGYLESLYDVSDLFEKYFSTFIGDKDDFSNNFNIKCLGLIAFFGAIPYRRQDILTPILDSFEIPYSRFVDAIDKLGNLELVDIQYENVKIPEQNLATYLFYKAFINDGLLGFQTLIDLYFDNNVERFRDCVIPANNTFGYDNVISKITPALKLYHKSIEANLERMYRFLSIFWFYMESETLEFIYKEIEALPDNPGIEYEISEKESNKFNQNKILELIGNFFRFNSNLKNSLELAFEYTHKLPEHLPELIHKIREEISFDENDPDQSFFRQITLYDIITEGINRKDRFFQTVFYELSKTFLQFSFSHTKSGRNNTIYWYDYSIPSNENVKDFREKIWCKIDNNFDENPEKTMDLLSSYYKNSHEVIKEIMDYDNISITTLIKNHLDPDNFEHCRFVQSYVRWLRRNSTSVTNLYELEQKYTNPIYKMSLLLDWDWLRDKEVYEYDDFDGYDKLKKAEIRDAFGLKSKEEADSFYNDYMFIKNLSEEKWSFNQSIDAVVDENLERTFDLGFYMLSQIIAKQNEINYVPHFAFKNHLKTQENADRIWKLISENSFKAKTRWELSFFDHLEDSLLSKNYAENIIGSIKNSTEPQIIFFERLDRYNKVKPGLFLEILEAINLKNDEHIKITTWTGFFMDYFDRLGDNLVPIKKAYLQQNKIQQNFDHKGRGMLNILLKNSGFLVEYVEDLYSVNDRLAGSNRIMNFIWEVGEIEKQVEKIFDLVNDKERYHGILPHFCNVFFRNLDDPKKERAVKFLSDYIKKNNAQYKKMNIVFDIVRNSIPGNFERLLFEYLNKNNDLESFKSVMWIGSSGVYFGEVIVGDLKAAKWRDLLSTIEKFNLGIKLIPIKKYVNDMINSSISWADNERKRRFLQLDR